MAVNRDLLEQRLTSIAEYLRRLEALAGNGPAPFSEGSLEAAAAESYLRRALEAVFDVGRHLLAKAGHTDLAGEYKAIARGLAQVGVVSPELGVTLVKMAGYRNRMVHLYDEVTEQELYTIIKSDLGDLRLFVKNIRDYLRSR